MGATRVTVDNLTKIKDNADKIVVSVVAQGTIFIGRISLGTEIVLESPAIFCESDIAEQIMQDMVDFANSGIYFHSLRDPSCPVRFWNCETPAEAEKILTEIAAKQAG